MRRIKLYIQIIIWFVPITFLCYLFFSHNYGLHNLKDGTYYIYNGDLVWELNITNGIFKTNKISNNKTKDHLCLYGDDFIVKVGLKKNLGWLNKDGQQIFCSKTTEVISPDKCEPIKFINSKTKTSFLFYYHPLSLFVKLDFLTNPKEKLFHRSISLISRNEEDLVVEEVCLGKWNIDGNFTGGGKGLPVFINNKWFFSGETPWFDSAINEGGIKLLHYPSAYLKQYEEWNSDSTIIGGGCIGCRFVLAEYISSIILHPKFFSLYNTWYDLRDKDLNTANVISNFVNLSTKLNQFEAQIDCCVIDDGWCAKDTLYGTNKNNFKNDLKEVAYSVETLGSKLGLWLPFSGLYLNNNDLKRYNFEEANSKFFCLSGTNYYNALSKRITELINNDHIAFFKHDFNFFTCTMPRHGHLRNIVHSEEANMRQTSKLLDLERKVNPDIVQAITTGINLSPWWLKYAQILWMGGGDIDFYKEFPVSCRAFSEMTYRDGRLFEILRENKTFFPLYAIMTHGIIDGKLNSVCPLHDIEQWSDYVMNYFGRGTAIRELYVDFSKLDKIKSEILARGLNWAKTRENLMINSEMILGDPRKNELYGFRGFDKQNNIYVSLRNPTFTDKEIIITNIGINSDYYRIIYPYHKICDSGMLPKLRIPAESVLMVESLYSKDIKYPTIINARTIIENIGNDKLQHTLSFDENASVPVYIYSPYSINNISGIDFRKSSRGIYEVPNIIEQFKHKIIITNYNIDKNKFCFNIEIPENVSADLLILIDDKSVDFDLFDNEKSILTLKNFSFNEANWKVIAVPLLKGVHLIYGISSDKELLKHKFSLQIRAKYNLESISVLTDSKNNRSYKFNTPFPVSQHVLKETIVLSK